MDFLTYLTFKNIRWTRRSTKGEIWVACPWCNDERLRFGLNYLKNFGHCFNCGAKKGGVVQAFMRALKLPPVILSDVLEDTQRTKEDKPELPEGFFLLSEINKKSGSLVWEPKRYLLERHVTEEQIKEHYIGATLEGRMRYRIVIPVHYRNELKGTVCRDYTGTLEPKYLNSRGEKSVYNLRPKKTSGLSDSLILSEGCFKALAIERVSKRFRSCALLGHSITELQTEQLIEAGFREVLLFSDPDRAGIKGTAKIAEALSEDRFNVRVCYPIPRAQADDLTEEELRHTLQHSEPWSIRLAARLKKESS